MIVHSMTFNGWAQILVFCIVIAPIVRPLGGYITRVLSGERTLLSPLLAPVERGFYRVAGVDAAQEQHWLGYTGAVVLFHLFGFAILYAILRLQGVLPFNPAGQGAVEQGLAFNTAASSIAPNRVFEIFHGFSLIAARARSTQLAVRSGG